jgi:hypothetical protein
MHVVARWCATHRLVVVGLWLLVLAAALDRVLSRLDLEGGGEEATEASETAEAELSWVPRT